jgi:hypothetical protein
MALGIRARRPLVIVVTAVVGGLLLGALDLLVQRTVPYPWANLANSSDVWAVGAFAIGAWVRTGRWWPALAGVLLLLVAVESYFLAAMLALHDAPQTLWAASTLLWLVFGVIAGVVFGGGGGWSRGPGRWRPAAGAALPGAVLLAEAALLIRRAMQAHGAYRAESLQTAAIEAALAVLVSLATGRTIRQRLARLALGVPLALAGFVTFTLTGFGG